MKVPSNVVDELKDEFTFIFSESGSRASAKGVHRGRVVEFEFEQSPLHRTPVPQWCGYVRLPLSHPWMRRNMKEREIMLDSVIPHSARSRRSGKKQSKKQSLVKNLAECDDVVTSLPLCVAANVFLETYGFAITYIDPLTCRVGTDTNVVYDDDGLSQTDSIVALGYALRHVICIADIALAAEEGRSVAPPTYDESLVMQTFARFVKTWPKIKNTPLTTEEASGALKGRWSSTSRSNGCEVLCLHPFVFF
jgi:hypothetical protein